MDRPFHEGSPNPARRKPLSRRELGTAALIASLAPAVQAQTPPDLANAVRDAQQRSLDTLAKYEVPIATEPAFQFKA